MNSSHEILEKGTSGQGTVSYLSYDSRGKAGRKIDGPQDLTFTFDRAERLTQVRETGGAVRVMETRTYGTSTSASDRSLGKLKTATRNNYHERFGVNFPSVLTYTYGGRDGRVSSLLHTINSTDSYTQTFVWNELGNLASQTYPTCNHCPVGTVPSRTVSYSYTQGFLTAVPNWATSITYHPNGLVNQITHANGVVSTQANDPNRMKRPASITVVKGTSTLFATGSYAYDGSGNVSKIGSDYYLYDTLGRLKEGTALQAGSSNRQTYGYDGFGNLTSTTSWVNGSGTTRTNAVVGTTNRLSAAGYDAAGNQTTWGTYGYTWDLMGMMKAYQGSGNDWAYAYDADDERMFVYNVVTGQSTFRIRGLDGKVLREVKLTGSTWSWGKDWIYRNGQLLATTAPGSVTRYVHADHLGSPRLFTDTAGVAKEKFHYYPFGEQAGTAPTAPEALRFTGHERDSGASTGTADDLDYMHARYYHPQLGRFLSVDPAGDSAKRKKPQTWNRFSYVSNNPLGYNDPDGQRQNPVTGQRGIQPKPKPGAVGRIRANASNPRVGQFGQTRNGGTKFHSGIDINAPKGTPVFAAEGGKVTDILVNSPQAGNRLQITTASGAVLTYAHLDSFTKGLTVGDTVVEGAIVGRSGTTGNAGGLPAAEHHLHFTVNVNGQRVDPVAWLNDPTADDPKIMSEQYVLLQDDCQCSQDQVMLPDSF